MDIQTRARLTQARVRPREHEAQPFAGPSTVTHVEIIHDHKALLPQVARIDILHGSEALYPRNPKRRELVPKKERERGRNENGEGVGGKEDEERADLKLLEKCLHLECPVEVSHKQTP